MECERLKGCPFYNGKMDIDSGLGRLYTNQYCLGDKTECARYKVLQNLGPEYVPMDLFPNMHDRAEKIIGENK